jgi:vacuolar-type H+-ATPase catalytic subunit A/Vma1
MSEKIVKINIELFKEKYNNIIDIPAHILEKADELKNNYNCFNSYYDPKMIWAKKIFNNKDKYNKPKIKNRVHIIIPEFTKTSETKRSLIGYLNKLSNKNKDVIYEKLKDIINNTDDKLDEIFNIIINYIKTNDDNIYSNILELFDKDFLSSKIDMYWDNYLVNKEWNPPSYIYENNLLLLNDEYDLYCDYIKWKKSIHNMNKVWVKYKPDYLIILYNKHRCI